MLKEVEFGSVQYKNRIYTHDIYVHPSGAVEPRRKELSSLVHGTSHKVVKAEMEILLLEDPDCVIIGTGYSGALHLTEEARDFLKQKGVFYQELLTPQAIIEFNHRYNCAILVHVTC
ncbi:MAG: hypothetical protein HXS41_15090 [Theionarchaea archaeon]|nr:hypothetical protein [Theionarchaea archaeon]MBU6999981.1 hypothetical protein [Theionarchaea archaeon]MBU7022377.1 hypothetical protein [Theionarchaea archaeon]MBU7035090.1 hypothetical protein [Theionarchaea archaeon]MBU7040688.1 hypothetical protein [Theionarchaea archaeon]